jgi:hypothetical protein
VTRSRSSASDTQKKATGEKSVAAGRLELSEKSEEEKEKRKKGKRGRMCQLAKLEQQIEIKFRKRERCTWRGKGERDAEAKFP